MSVSEQQIATLYQGPEPSFRTFRRHSTVHLETANRIARLVAKEAKNRSRLSVLDIGAGDGSFVELIVEGLNAYAVQEPIEFTWLDPNRESIKQLAIQAAKLPQLFKARFFQEKWQDHQPDRQYDVIIAAQVLYNFPEKEQPVVFKKMIDALSPGGVLFIEARTRGDDDDYFTKMFIKRANNIPDEMPFPNLTIETADKALRDIRDQCRFNFEITYDEHTGIADLPIDPNDPDVPSLIHFYFLVHWEVMPPDLRADIFAYLQTMQGKLLEREGDIYVTKIQKDEKPVLPRLSV